MVAKLLWAGAPIATNSLTVQNKIITGQISLTGEFHMDNRNMDEMLPPSIWNYHLILFVD